MKKLFPIILFVFALFLFVPPAQARIDNQPVTSSTLISSSSIQTNFPDYVSPFNSYVFFPKPSALIAGLANCGGVAGVSDAGTCYNDILAAAPASGTKLFAQGFDYSAVTWAVAFNQNRNQVFLDMQCVPNATKFTWTGSGSAIFINSGSAGSGVGYIAHPTPFGFQGCTFINAAGHNSTSGLMVLGGTQGAEGFTAIGNKFVGWGGTSTILFSDNTYYTNITWNIFADNKSHIIVPGGLTNSTENLTFDHNEFGDCFSGIATTSEQNCIQFTNASDVNWTDNQTDDAQMVIHSGVWNFHIKGGQCEDPALTGGTHSGYPCIKIDDSATSHVIIEGFTMVHDGANATTTSDAFIYCGSNLTINGVTAIANNASTSAYFIKLTGANCKYTAQGVVNISGTGFTQMDQNAPTSTAGLQRPYASFTGTSTIVFSVATGTITRSTYDQFSGWMFAHVIWVSTNTAGTSNRLTYPLAFNFNPSCSITPASGTNAVSIVRSSLAVTTSVIWSDSSAFPAYAAWDVACHGNPN